MTKRMLHLWTSMGTEPLTVDCAMVSDCDGDGGDDASDAFDADPEAWDDFDGDGLADIP